MNEETTNIIDNKNMVINIITVNRLYNIDSDAATLYFFYAKNSVIQETNSIYATNTFCMKGLNWGEKRFYKAKAILEDNNFIEMIVNRDEKGRVKGNYIKLNYIKNDIQTTTRQNGNTDLSSTSSDRKPDETGSSSDRKPDKASANACNKNRNACNRKENACNENLKKDLSQNQEKIAESVKYIFDFWNSQKIIVHKSLSKRLVSLISRAIDLTSANDVMTSIENYSKILKSDKHFFSYKWSLSEFLSRGLSKKGQEEKKGFLMFQDSENPFRKFSNFSTKSDADEFTMIRNSFTPMTVLYDRQNLLDRNNNTYFGFHTDALQDITLIKLDLDHIFSSSGVVSFSDFCDLELVVAYYLWTRKSNPNYQHLQLYFDKWEKHKDEFKSKARLHIKEHYT